MQRLINFEFKKLFTSVSFYVCLIIAVVFALINGLIVDVEYLKLGQFDPDGTKAQFIFSNLSITLSIILTICSIVISINVCDDFRRGTIKNIKSRGFSNTAIYFSKYLVSVVGSLILIALDILVFSLVVIPIHTTNEPIYLNFTKVIISYILIIVAYISLYFFLAISMRKLALSIIGSLFIPEIIGIALTLIQLIIRSGNPEFSNSISSYWLYAAAGSFTEKYTTRYIVESIIYILGFSGLGYLCSFKREIK